MSFYDILFKKREETMNTYNINKDKVKITLTDDEVNDLFGGYDLIDYNCPRSRAVLDSLLLGALPESMLPLDCKQVLIEVTEEKSGCSIQVTRLYEKAKKLHKISGKYKYILLFESSEDMIKFITQNELGDKFPKSELIKSGEKYALCFHFERPVGHYNRLSEYGKLIDAQSPEGAAIKEYGTMICKNAAEKLSAAFKK